jgi:hypothetical protein
MHVLKRLASSTFVITIILLVAFDLFVTHVKPLMLLNDTGLTSMNQNFLVSKLPEIMNSNANKDVLLLGSSLVLVPAVRCDDQLAKRRTRFDLWYYRNVIDTYCDADYLSAKLTERLGKPVSICNAAVAASVMSDDYLVTKKYLDTGKRPKVAVICVAPREFLDALRTDVTQTATHSVLSDFSTFYDDLHHGKDFQAIANSAVGMVWTFFRTRSDYLTFVSSAGGRITGHPISLFDAAQAKTREAAAAAEPKPAAQRPKVTMNNLGPLNVMKPVYEQPPNTLGDIEGYKKMYLPINSKQFATQQGYFKKLLTLLKKNNVPVVVVDFPVTAENYALLPQSVVSDYQNFLTTTCSSFGVPLVKPADQAKFETKADFEDCAHMNASGGSKFFDALAQSIASDREIAATLAPTNLADSSRQSAR